MIGYTDAWYLLDPHNTWFQIGYVFTCESTTISWRSIKQTIVATSSNHLEILTIHEVNYDCVWLKFMIKLIRESYE